jgi:hypothetical protein
MTLKTPSQNYLGKSITYYGYRKCTNSKPSKSALINLWRQLKQDAYKCDEYAERSRVDWPAEEYKQHKQKLEGLCTSLLQDIMYDTPTDMQQNQLF